jgi:hypothetical protein
MIAWLALYTSLVAAVSGNVALVAGRLITQNTTRQPQHGKYSAEISYSYIRFAASAMQ